ncbi:MAG: IPTL-CTERM sorting domain-containing protein [Thermodesulfobacteriota bacterium]
MTPRYRTVLFIVSFILTGLFFFSLTESGFAGSSPGGPPCCDIPSIDFCYGGGAVSQCSAECLNSGDCILYQDQICVLDGSDPAFGSCQLFQSNIPTLGEWGMIILAMTLGIVGYMIIRRKKAAA